jgi:hypothetical protein
VADEGSDRLLALLADVGGGPALIRRICELCVSDLAVSGASVSVMGGSAVDGSQVLMHTTSPIGVQLEDLQLTVGEGPSVDAYNSSGPVLVADLTTEYRRWPVFVPGAIALGVTAVFSFPLQIGAARMGVLDLYRNTTGPLAKRQLIDAFQLVEASTVAVLDNVEAGPEMGPLLGDMHNGVHQATGIVTVQLGVSVHDALLRIRAHAFSHQLTLNEVGRQIVSRELRLKMED